MLSLYNVATAILLMVVQTFVSAHPNIPQANLQDREEVWPQHLEGGRCTNDDWKMPGSNWAGGNKKSTQDQCQQECASDPDCKFYCYGKDKSWKTFDCLRYKACPALATKSHRYGKDVSSYTCYMKPVTGQCTNTRDTDEAKNSCSYQMGLAKDATCNNYLGWKDCDKECGLCACSTAHKQDGAKEEHCSGHGTCKVDNCTVNRCENARCECDAGWKGAQCDIEA